MKNFCYIRQNCDWHKTTERRTRKMERMYRLRINRSKIRTKERIKTKRHCWSIR